MIFVCYGYFILENIDLYIESQSWTLKFGKLPWCRFIHRPKVK